MRSSGIAPPERHIRGVYDYPGTFADSLAPHAFRFGLRRGDASASSGGFSISSAIRRRQSGWERRKRITSESPTSTPAEPATERRSKSMTAHGPYKTPAAFRRALTDELRELSKESRWNLPQLQRQMAYDRLLERLYLVDDCWIVKGPSRSSPGTSAFALRKTLTYTDKASVRRSRPSYARPPLATSAIGSDSKLGRRKWSQTERPASDCRSTRTLETQCGQVFTLT